LKKSPKNLSFEQKKALCDQSWLTYQTHLLSQTLSKGLATRTTLTRVISENISSWNYNEKPKKPRRVLVGLIVNQEKAFKLVEMGPPANDNEKVEIIILFDFNFIFFFVLDLKRLIFFFFIKNVRLWNFVSFGEKNRKFDVLKTVRL
jgi:hypothetical protein